MPAYILNKDEFHDLLRAQTGDATNEEIALKVGISAEYVRKMRKTGLVPTRDILKKLSDGLGLDYEDLCTACGYSEQNYPQDKQGDNRERRAEFGSAVGSAMIERGWSARLGSRSSGIDYNTVNSMRNGVVPRRGLVIEWAEALGENINRWLRLAGYGTINPALVREDDLP